MTGAVLPPSPGLVPGDRFVAIYVPGANGLVSHAQLTCRWCGQETSVANPIPDRMAMATGWHRCGPRGTRWNEGDDTPAAQGVSSETSASHAVTLGWFADLVEAEPADTYVDDRAFKAAQRLAEQLHVKLSAVAEPRHLSLTRRPVAPGEPLHRAGGRRR